MARCRNLASIRGHRQAHPPTNIRTGMGVQGPSYEEVVARRRARMAAAEAIGNLAGAFKAKFLNVFRRKRTA